MTEQPKPSSDDKPEPQDADDLRLSGAVLMAAGLGTALLVTFTVSDEDVRWPLLVICLMAALSGIGLRIEAAIRDRP
ncbi:hypothetical protein [Nonomuraea insulae]|uniref:Uncharacterized protein n=1 Tax=Nonomuraea insulae TaxID=1616787 RepID=A0ABW1CDA7_9ACTN